MNRYWLVLLPLCLVTPGLSANKFVRPNSFATGSNNGNDWDNAYQGFGAVTWTATNTYWVAGGLYTNRCDITANGVTVKRALSTDSTATSAAGWDASFDSVVLMSNTVVPAILRFSTAGLSDITVDGRTNYGIRVFAPNTYQSGNGSQGIRWGALYHDVRVYSVEAFGPFTGTNGINVYDDLRPFDHYSPGDGLIVSNCWFHGGSSVMFLRYATNALLVASAFGDSHNLNYSVATDFIENGTNFGNYHQNLCQVEACNNVRISRCWFYNWEVEGFMVLSHSLDFTFDNCVFNGNTDWTVARFLEFQAACGNFHVLNCTFANVPSYFIRQISSAGAGSSCSNNLVINCGGIGTGGGILGFGNGLDDYNLTTAIQGVPGTHSISNSTTDVFTSYSSLWSATTANFLISSNISTLYPAQKGADLGSTFATDYAGNTHGAGGAPWSMGAFEATNAVITTNIPIRAAVWF